MGSDEITEHQVREPEIFERDAVARLSDERLFEGGDRIMRTSRHEQRDREQDQRIGVTRCALQYLLAEKLRAGGVPRLQAFVRLTELAV